MTDVEKIIQFAFKDLKGVKLLKMKDLIHLSTFYRIFGIQRLEIQIKLSIVDLEGYHKKF